MSNIIDYDNYKKQIIEAADIFLVNVYKEFKDMKFTVHTRCDVRGVLISILPNSRTLDIIGDNKEQFKENMKLYLTQKMGIKVSEDTESHAAGYNYFIPNYILSETISNILKF